MAGYGESETLIITRPNEVAVVEVSESLVSHAEQGPRGAPGEKGERGEKGMSGSTAFLSEDADNRSRIGSDGGLFTPELVSDPLAYYILAKS